MAFEVSQIGIMLARRLCVGHRFTWNNVREIVDPVRFILIIKPHRGIGSLSCFCRLYLIVLCSVA